MKIGAYELESPLFNGGGVVKSVEDARAMASTGVGAVLLGSYTLEPRAGNSPDGETVYYHDPATGTTHNSLGMPNKGIKDVARDLPEMTKIAHQMGKPIILNIAPVSDNPSSEISSLFDELIKAGVTELDAVELNAGCPNVIMNDGARHELLSHHPEQMVDVLGRIRDIANDKLGIGSVFVRVSPFRNKDDVVSLVEGLSHVQIDAVSAFNTFTGGRPIDAVGTPILQVPNNLGGQSGRGMTTLAEEQTAWLIYERDNQGLTFDVLGSNGIYDGKSMKRRLDLGAKAVSATTIFFESESWGTAVYKILDEYADLI